jgi:PKD repeat protein
LGGKAKADFRPSSTSGCAPFTITFNNQSSFSSTYFWNMGDSKTSTDISPSKTYTKPGTYRISLTVYDSAQQPVDSFSTNISVYSSPTAVAYFTQTADSVVFVNKSVGADYYYWIFSNGMTSQGFAPKLKLKGPATFQLTAYSNNGCQDTISGMIWKTGLDEATNNTIGLTIYPNPFSDKTAISYTLQQPSDVTIEVYNLLGELVMHKALLNQTTGAHNWQLDTLTANGLYLVKVTTNKQSGVQRILKN